MIRTKLLSRYSTLAVRALVTASAAERCFTSGRCFHNHCATDIPTASVHHHQNVKDVHASCCGFPKHLKNGPSTVLDQGVFGDDACFIAHFENTYVVGVADGVGGWRNYGIDPSEFSSRLMKLCRKIVVKGQFKPTRPDKLLARAYEALARPPRPIGSSTACVLIVHQDTLYSANLGDSGYLVIRNGKVVYRSREQTHYFNAPYQLSLPPTDEGNGSFLGDSPEKAESASLDLMSGDIIVLATDGLWDNVTEDEIVKQLSGLKPGDVQKACNSLALTARRLAFDTQHLSPFAVKASQHGIDAPGGKPDDITLILLLIA
uniref:Protein phosphatase n=1 Tax=Elaeophora elaphi TaxID=1147741 RepID=A0A0R3RQ43_9BILA